MDLILSPEEKENKKRGLIFSIIFHIAFLLLALLPFFNFPIPPPGQEGILVSLGIPDVGEGDDRPKTQNEEIVEPKPVSEAVTKPVEKEEVREEVESVNDIDAAKDVLTTETPAEIAIRKQKEEEARKKQQEELERIRLEEIERQKAEEEARKQAEYEEAKTQYGNLLGGTGKGETGTPGNQGDPGGDPDASILEGISSGSGKVGGGLGNRGVVFEPSIKDSSQKTGRVVVKVCVNSSGDVASAQYTQKGSTTTDADLKDLAVKSARRFRFTPSDIDTQCGTITIDFKVK
jgi:TonB family protein